MYSIVIGPDWIEFGWLLMRFQAKARWVAQGHERAGRIVICEKGHEYLYRDFCDRFHTYKMPGRRDRWLYEGSKPKMPADIKQQYEGALRIIPSEEVCMSNFDQAIYIPYGTKRDSMNYDLVIHARSLSRYTSGDRNWGEIMWGKFVNELGPKRVCCIGKKDSASYVPGSEDLRGIPLEQVCDILASSKVCVGTSSGPMHLASLCGCPHVVITGPEKHKSLGGRTNRDRYEKLWNPLKTPVIVVDKYGWRPKTVTPVVEAVCTLYSTRI